MMHYFGMQVFKSKADIAKQQDHCVHQVAENCIKGLR